MEPPSKKKKTDISAASSAPEEGFLVGLHIYILQAGIGRVRTKLFKEHIKNKGGMVHEEYQPGVTTHIIVDEKMESPRLCKLMSWDHLPTQCLIVKSLWLSSCLKHKCKVDTENFELGGQVDQLPAGHGSGQSSVCSEAEGIQSGMSGIQKVSTASGPSQSTGASNRPITVTTHRSANRTESDADSDYIASGDENSDHGDDSSSNPSQDDPGYHGYQQTEKNLPKGNWVCARSSKAPRTNHNKHITDKLEALAKTYENTNDKWRALGYAKAITILKAHPKEITSFEQAKSLPGVGNKLAEKIWEIIESGELRKLNELSSSEEIKAINLFTGVWGAGATTARMWVTQGFRTLEDLHNKATLTRNQKIGLAYYDDLLDRMSRAEAAEIEEKVIEAARSIDKDIIAMACGSYRRGKPTCGDVDVLVTHPDGKSHRGIFQKLLCILKETGFLTDDLVSHEDSGNQQKYLGVCQLPGAGRRHRRLDIIVVPYDEFACASMYFTGSAHFNRSMRNLASKMGMSLNEHGLFAGVLRQRGEKITKGQRLHTPDEKSVFKHLGLTYRPPLERDH